MRKSCFPDDSKADAAGQLKVGTKLTPAQGHRHIGTKLTLWESSSLDLGELRFTHRHAVLGAALGHAAQVADVLEHLAQWHRRLRRQSRASASAVCNRLCCRQRHRLPGFIRLKSTSTSADPLHQGVSHVSRQPGHSTLKGALGPASLLFRFSVLFSDTSRSSAA